MFWEENKDALFALPSEIKQVIIIAMVLAFLASVISKAWGFLKYIILAGILYFALTSFGIF